jgi:hypothetical protein
MSNRYKIVIAGKLSEQWADWLESVDTVYRKELEQTMIYIDVVDQTALHGVLERIRDLHLHLVSVQQQI